MASSTSSNSRLVKLTFFSILLLSLFTLSSATSSPVRRHTRMIRRKGGDVSANSNSTSESLGVINAPSAPSTNSATNTATGAASSTTDPAGASSTTDTATAGQSSTTSNLIDTLTNIVGGSSSTQSATTTNTALNTSATANATASTTTALNSTTTTSSSTTSSSSQTQEASQSTLPNAFVTVTSSLPGSATNTADSANVSDASAAAAAAAPTTHIARTTVIALASIAGSVGLIFVIWTVIRKWKFRPSREFEDRLRAVDWEPTSHGSGGSSSGGRDMTSVRRESLGSMRSGRSAAHYGATSDEGGRGAGGFISDLPSHDFTAGPAGGRGLAPVGQYADLRRGPSPQPGQYYGAGRTGY